MLCKMHNLVQSKFASKILTCGKNLNFAQKIKCRLNIQNFFKNPKFRQKSIFSSKIQILFKKKTNFRGKSKILLRNPNFAQMPKFSPTILKMDTKPNSKLFKTLVRHSLFDHKLQHCYI